MTEEFTEAELERVDLFCDTTGCMNRNHMGYVLCQACLSESPQELNDRDKELKRRWDERERHEWIHNDNSVR